MLPTENWTPGRRPDSPDPVNTFDANIGSGSAAPDNGSGLDGDIYIRDNGSVYRKVNGVWTLLFTSSGGGGGSVQTYEFTTTDPTTDGIVPDDQNSAAIAYKRDGTGPIYVWNTVTHAWL